MHAHLQPYEILELAEPELLVMRSDPMLDMQRFTDAGAIFRSHRDLPAPPQLVDAVLRAVA